jgi:hypothetical protein
MEKGRERGLGGSSSPAPSRCRFYTANNTTTTTTDRAGWNRNGQSAGTRERNGWYYGQGMEKGRGRGVVVGAELHC